MRTLAFIALVCTVYIADAQMILKKAQIIAAGGVAAASSGPTLVAQDDFSSYTDATSISGANWSMINGTVSKFAVGGMSVIGGASQSAAISTATFNDNQRSELTYTNNGAAGSGSFVGVVVRGAAGDSRYWFQTDGSAWYLVVRVSGSQTVLANNTLSIVTWEKIAIEVSGTGTATRLKAQYYHGGNWVDIVSNVDPGTGKYLNSGAAGVQCDGAAKTTATGTLWKGYNL